MGKGESCRKVKVKVVTMPRCNACGRLIHSGQFCDVCGREEELKSHEPPEGPDYVQCGRCDGLAYLVKDGEKVDCPRCDGFGKVQIDDSELATDGGEIIDADREDQEIVVAKDGGEILDE